MRSEEFIEEVFEANESCLYENFYTRRGWNANKILQKAAFGSKF